MDGICLRTGIHHHGINPAISVSGYLDGRPSPSQVSAVGRTGAAEKSLNTNLFSRFSFRYPLKSLWPGGDSSGRYNGLAVDDAVMVENGERKAIEENVSAMGSEERQNENWVLKILHVRSLWGEKRVNTTVNSDNVKIEAAQVPAVEDEEEAEGADCAVKDQENDCHFDEKEEACDDCRVDFDVDDDDIQLDRNSFSRLLKRVSLAEARLYAQMCYLGSLAYSIPKIKPGNLLQQYGLRFVTSSIEKKELAAKTEKDQMLTKSEKQESNDKEEKKAKKTNGYRISASAAHEIAASAAVYLHSRTKSILPFKSSKVEVGESALEGRHETSDVGNIQEEVASFMATTDSVTAVVAAKEEVKQAVADDLKSTTSSPCEWFVCDDESGTRFFLIQGSETLQSWQANLLFEPVKFEGMDVPVHRGIYEAAKGIYEQMLPEVQSHLKSHGDCATFRFTGHSLGGSLAVLVNLMLLIRQEVPVTSLLPVVTFGAPSIMCGGDNLLDRLGLPKNHVQAITMHRDIVPRAFSCNYPGHVAELLKAINGNFRTHPCLNNKKLLYAPMGELLILQPDEKFSPHHHLLPSGSGLYLMSSLTSESNDADKHLMAAKLLFLNSPHPLEILSDRSAYGSDGTIQRDHDMNSYLKSLRSVIRQELNHIRRLRREQRRKVWWPLVSYQRTDSDVVFGRELVSAAMRHDQFNFSGILETGKQSMTRFSRLVASQHMHLLVVFTFPAKLLLLGTYGIIRLR